MGHKEFIASIFDLTGKTALVTGATKGLGKDFALTLAQAGADVAVCSRHENEAIQAAEEIAEASDSKTFGMAADVSVKNDIEKLIRKTEENLGPIDILVASAGINIRKETPDLTEADWDAIMEINVKGSFMTAQALIPSMRERGWGRIIFLGSMLSYISITGRAAYASSKTALLGLTRTLALECAKDGIAVNAICPGPFKTPMNIPVYTDEKKNKNFIKKLPVGRWGDTDELRGLLLLLASDAASYMHGSAIVIDGAWTCQ